MKIEGYIGTEFTLAKLPGLWLSASYKDSNWLFSGETREGQELVLQDIWADLLPGVPLPFPLDIKVKNVIISFLTGNPGAENANYKLHLEAAVAVKIDPSEDFSGELNIQKIALTYEKSASDEKQTSVQFELIGNARLHDWVSAHHCHFNFDYGYNHDQKTSDWQFDGELTLEMLGRYLHFKGKAAKLKESGSISFTADFAAVVYPHYFQEIPDLDTEHLFQKLAALEVIEQKEKLWLLKGNSNNKEFDLGSEYKAQQVVIKKTLQKISLGNSLYLPDFGGITANDNIAAFALQDFKVELEFKNGKPSGFLIGGTADLTLWNPLNNGKTLLESESGKLEIAANETGKSLMFLPGKTEIKLLGLLPVPDAIKDGFLVGLKEFTVSKDGTGWNLMAGAYLQIEKESLEALPGSASLMELFPPVEKGKKQRMEGVIALSSQNGFSLKFKNKAFALTPNPSLILKEALQELLNNLERILTDKPELKPLFEALQELNHQLPDLGKVYICLHEVNIHLSDTASFSTKLALGLPEKLNEVLFDSFPEPLKSLKGIINTYRPNDVSNSVMMAELSLSGDGISGSLGNFPPVNRTKASELIEKASNELKNILDKGIHFITEDKKEKKLTDKELSKESIKSIVIDFDGLMGKQGAQKVAYGKIAIDIPEISYSFKTGAFSIKGGCRVLSDCLNVPLPFEPLFLLLGLPELAQFLPDKIPVRSLSFINDNKLSLDELESYLKGWLPEAKKSSFNVVFDALRPAVEKAGDLVVNKLPDRLKDYMGIHLPKGFQFDLQITADQSFSFSLEVGSPEYKITAAHLDKLRSKLTESEFSKLKILSDEVKEYHNIPALRRAIRKNLTNEGWEKHHREIIKIITTGDFYDALQLLIPLVNSQPALIGVRVRKIAFGTALFNQVFRVDFSGEIDHFNPLEIAPALLIPQPGKEENETLHFILPRREKLQKSILLDQLIVFVVYHTGVPIPIPVYASEFDLNNSSILGEKAQLRWSAEANMGATDFLKKLTDLKTFFTEKDKWLSIQDYPLSSSSKPPELRITAGPNYVQLPGILGYEHNGNKENKKHIVIGSREVVEINPLDLIGVGANTVKGMILRQNIPVPPAKEGVPPLNYLIQYLPLNKRVGEKHIVLFHLFELSARWLLTTPQEFEEGAWKYLNGSHTSEDLLSLVPVSTGEAENKEGMVAFFQGKFSILDVASFDAAFVTAATGNGLAAGFNMKGNLGNVITSELKGSLLVEPKNEQQPFVVKGSGFLTFCGKNVLEGDVALNKERLTLSGEFDLFPTIDFLHIKGKVDGVFKKESFYFNGKVGCRLGFVTLVAAQVTFSNEEFTITGTFLNQTITLAIQQKNGSLRFFATMSPVKLGEFFQLTDAVDYEKGPQFFVELNQLNYKAPELINKRTANEMLFAGWVKSKEDIGWQGEPGQKWEESVEEISSIEVSKNPFFKSDSLEAWEPGEDKFKVYVSGRVLLLGLESSTLIVFTDKQFELKMKGKLFNLFASELKITGRTQDDSNDLLWKGDGEWQGEGVWINKNVTDWGKSSLFEFTGSLEMLGAAMKSSGELSIEPEASSGKIKLWIEDENSIFKGCDLNLSFWQSQSNSIASLIIGGNMLEAAFKAALQVVSSEVNKFLTDSIIKLKEFDAILEEKKEYLRSAGENIKRDLQRNYEFWSQKVTFLQNTLHHLNFEKIRRFFEQYYGDAKNAMLHELYKEKSAHTKWYNSEYRHPWDWAAYKVKQKFLDDVIWYVNEGMSTLLYHIEIVRPVFDLLFPVIRQTILQILHAAQIALRESKKLLEEAIDKGVNLGTAALNLAQEATGFTRSLLVKTKEEFDQLSELINTYLTAFPVKIIRTSINANLNQFTLRSFTASVEVLITPLTGVPFTKKITSSIYLDDLVKTAGLILEANKDILNLNELPSLKAEENSNSFSTRAQLFSEETELIISLRKEGNASFLEQLNGLSEKGKTELHTIYEEALDLENSYNSYTIGEKLGEAIGTLIQLASTEEQLASGEAKKEFVMENTVLISRFMDKGITGKNNNIHNKIQGFEFLSTAEKAFEEQFIRPMTDRAIESLWNN